MNAIPVRVMVEDAWDQVTLALKPAASIAEAKRQALAVTHTRGDPAEYLVKFRGAEVEEAKSLADAGIVANAALIVMPRRRRPVR